LIDDEPEKKHFQIGVDRIARTYGEGIAALQERRWDLLLLDHDLGEFDADGNELTGHSVATWLENNPSYLPIQVVAVSRSPVGKDRINAAIESARRRAEREGIDTEGPLGVTL
jgi:CheY-like chemotaxis protein